MKYENDSDDPRADHDSAFLYQFQESPRPEFAQALFRRLPNNKRQPRKLWLTRKNSVLLYPYHWLALSGILLAFVVLGIGLLGTGPTKQVLFLGDVRQVTPTVNSTVAPSQLTTAVSELSLGPVPSTCPVAPEPMQIDPQYEKAMGGYPIWGIGFQGPTAQLVFPNDLRPPQFIFNTTFGWGKEVLWIVRRSYTSGKVTLSGRNLTNNKPLAFSVGGLGPRTEIQLYRPLSDAMDQDWVLYHSRVYVPMAGCYELHITWDGGSWALNFAAGQADQKLASAASPAALATISPGKVAVTIPDSLINNKLNLLEVGAKYDIICTFLFVDIDPTLVANGTLHLTVIDPTRGVSNSGSVEIGASQVSTPEADGTQVPRKVAQVMIKDAELVHIGLFSMSGDTLNATPLPTNSSNDQQVVTLSVNPSDATILAWLSDAKIPITLIPAGIR